MKTPHLLAYALSTPWALMPERMAAYAAVLARHYSGEMPPAAKPTQTASAAAPSALQAEVSAMLYGEPAAAAPGQSAAPAGGIAVVPVFGAIVEWAYQIDICDGGTSARSVARALMEAEADPTVGQILMVFNTPGGSVYGIQECGDVMNRVKASKPIIGISQSLAASAGYWLLAQCTEAYCTPGGEVGSIGVYSGYENIAEALKMAGVSVELFSAGKYKTEMSPFGEGLSDEARAYQQQRAQDYYGAFTKAVAKGRKVGIDKVRNGMGEGRVLGADAALAAGMVDGVMTMEDVLKKMQRGSKSGRPSSAELLTNSNHAAAAAARAREIDLLSLT